MLCRDEPRRERRAGTTVITARYGPAQPPPRVRPNQFWRPLPAPPHRAGIRAAPGPGARRRRPPWERPPAAPCRPRPRLRARCQHPRMQGTRRCSRGPRVARHGSTWPGVARRGSAWPGMARHRSAWPGMARHTLPRTSRSKQSPAQQCGRLARGTLNTRVCGTMLCCWHSGLIIHPRPLHPHFPMAML